MQVELTDGILRIPITVLGNARDRSSDYCCLPASVAVPCQKIMANQSFTEYSQFSIKMHPRLFSITRLSELRR